MGSTPIESTKNKKEKEVLKMNTQNNGNTQLNDSRESFNDRVLRLKNLGSTKGVIWKNKKRNRTI